MDDILNAILGDGTEESGIAEGDDEPEVVEITSDLDARVAAFAAAPRKERGWEVRRPLVAKLREAGLSSPVIARELRVDVANVWKDIAALRTSGEVVEPKRVIGKDGVSHPATKPSQAELAVRRTLIVRLRDQGVLLRQIAPAFGVSVDRVSKDAMIAKAQHQQQQSQP